MLTELRTEISADLVAAGLRSVEYVAEVITPPVAVVVPGVPYLRWGGPGVPFGHVTVRFDVLALTVQGASKKSAELIDSMIEDVMAALDEWDVVDVTQPGLVELNGSKFMGSVIAIEQTIKEP